MTTVRAQEFLDTKRFLFIVDDIATTSFQHAFEELEAGYDVTLLLLKSEFDGFPDTLQEFEESVVDEINLSYGGYFEDEEELRCCVHAPGTLFRKTDGKTSQYMLELN